MKPLEQRNIQCVVISGSAGAIEALNKILPNLKTDLPFPVVCVLHMAPDGNNLLVPIFAQKCQLPVKEAESTEHLQPGTLYFGPVDYHLSIETDRTFSLSNEPPLNYSRPSLDIFFSSAAEAFENTLAAVLLSGANADGAQGLLDVYEKGGVTVVQDPAEAPHPTMPESAMAKHQPHFVLPVSKISELINAWAKGGRL